MLYACVITHLFSDENLLSSKKKAKKKKEKKRRKRKKNWEDKKTRTNCNIQNDSNSRAITY